MKLSRSVCVLIWAACFITPCTVAIAGKLADFEKSASSDSSSSGRNNTRNTAYYDADHYHPRHDGRGFFGFFCDVFYEAFWGSSYPRSREAEQARSEQAVNALLETNAVPVHMESEPFNANTFWEQRVIGSPITPCFRADYSYTWAESDITADNYFVELGYRMVSMDFLQTHYRESDPDDTLDLTRIYGQLRFAATETVEFDIGLGGIIMDGDDHNTGGYYGMALRIYPDSRIGGEFRLFGASIDDADITDLDIGLFLGFDYILFKTGYQIVSTGDEDISGFYLGASIRL